MFCNDPILRHARFGCAASTDNALCFSIRQRDQVLGDGGGGVLSSEAAVEGLEEALGWCDVDAWSIEEEARVLSRLATAHGALGRQQSEATWGCTAEQLRLLSFVVDGDYRYAAAMVNIDSVMRASKR